jgi:lysozyme
MGETTHGVDVSRWQGDIDWPLLASADVEFAYIQISRAIDDLDPKFEINWAGAKAAGLARGAYQRFQPDQDVLGQADIFLDKLGPFQAGDLPPMLDVEDANGLSPTQIADAVREWLVYVEAATSVRPIIYTGRYFWEDDLASADFSDYPLWIAHYTDGCPTIPSPWTDWALHQYSDQAVLPGVTENTVDVNHFNGSLEDLLALACGDECPPCRRLAVLAMASGGRTRLTASRWPTLAAGICIWRKRGAMPSRCIRRRPGACRVRLSTRSSMAAN